MALSLLTQVCTSAHVSQHDRCFPIPAAVIARAGSTRSTGACLHTFGICLPTPSFSYCTVAAQDFPTTPTPPRTSLRRRRRPGLPYAADADVWTALCGRASPDSSRLIRLVSCRLVSTRLFFQRGRSFLRSSRESFSQ